MRFAWLTHHGGQLTAGGPSPRRQTTCIASISPGDWRSGTATQQIDQHQLGAVPALDSGVVNLRGQQAVCGRLPTYQRRIPAALFPVVFTDWISMTAALDVDDPTADSQSRERKASPYSLPGDVIPPVVEVPPNSAPRNSASGGPAYCTKQDVQDAVYHIEQVRGGMLPSV